MTDLERESFETRQGDSGTFTPSNKGEHDGKHR
jgi:hypothetical protein